MIEPHRNEKRARQETAHWEQLESDVEDCWGWTSPAGQIRAERRAKWIIEAAAVSQNSKVLEIGCGTGIYTELLATTGADITACDLMPSFLARARERIKTPKVNFDHQDVHRMTFAPGTFDVVCGVSVLHHLDIAAALDQIFHVLKTGGRCVFSEPNMLNPQIALQKNIPWLKRISGDSPDETAFFRWRLSAAFARGGFEKIKIEPFDFLHPATPSSLCHAVDRVGRLLERIPLLKEIAGSLFISAQKS